jgi:hypothetical protein
MAHLERERVLDVGAAAGGVGAIFRLRLFHPPRFSPR